MQLFTSHYTMPSLFLSSDPGGETIQTHNLSRPPASLIYVWNMTLLDMGIIMANLGPLLSVHSFSQLPMHLNTRKTWKAEKSLISYQ